jgi:hypothetical protein
MFTHVPSHGCYPHALAKHEVVRAETHQEDASERHPLFQVKIDQRSSGNILAGANLIIVSHCKLY